MTIVPAPVGVCPTGGVLINDIPVCNGHPGHPGVGLVSVSRPATPLECPINGGSATDIYRDLDFNGIVSPSDVLVSGLVACNGNNALTPVKVFNLNHSHACIQLSIDISFDKPSPTSNNVRIYNSLHCSGTPIATLSPTGNEVLITNDYLLILEGTNGGAGMTSLTLRALHLQ